jgi:tetratricopeptide (TPR) repeat protein
MQRNLQNRIFIAACLVLLIGAAGCDKLKARDQLNKGVQAYRNAQFDVAIEHFKTAEQLDPGLTNARLYLATAYASQYIPGAPSDENMNMAKQAIAEFQDILKDDPNNLTAVDGIGSLLTNMGGNPYDEKKLEESKQYHLKHIAIKPEDPEPYYWVAFIDWSIAYHGNAEMREEYNKTAKKQVREIDPMPEKLVAQYAQKYGSVIDEGIEYEKKAMDRRQQYDDAMSYLSLLYRRKADMETNAQARDADTQQADDLMHKIQIIRQQRMENPSGQSGS